MAITDKEIAKKDTREAAEMFIAACYQQIIVLDVFTEMELIQEILNLIGSIRETMTIMYAPAPLPVRSETPAYAAETMIVPAINLPQVSYGRDTQ